MDRIARAVWNIPPRLAAGYARGLLVASIAFLALAALGMTFDDLPLRVLYISAIGAIGLSNLTLSLGSLAPEEQGGRMLRGASRFFVVAMVLTLPAAVVLAVL